jgi:hypothetical protein
MNIEEVLKNNESMILGLPEVTGVGLGEKNGKMVIIVFVRESAVESAKKAGQIPKSLGGFETDIRPEVRVGL